jgi:hypothetical protein
MIHNTKKDPNKKASLFIIIYDTYCSIVRNRTHVVLYNYSTYACTLFRTLFLRPSECMRQRCKRVVWKKKRRPAATDFEIQYCILYLQLFSHISIAKQRLRHPCGATKANEPCLPPHQGQETCRRYHPEGGCVSQGVSYCVQ